MPVQNEYSTRQVDGIGPGPENEPFSERPTAPATIWGISRVVFFIYAVVSVIALLCIALYLSGRTS